MTEKNARGTSEEFSGQLLLEAVLRDACTHVMEHQPVEPLSFVADSVFLASMGESELTCFDAPLRTSALSMIYASEHIKSLTLMGACVGSAAREEEGKMELQALFCVEEAAFHFSADQERPLSCSFARLALALLFATGFKPRRAATRLPPAVAAYLMLVCMLELISVPPSREAPLLGRPSGFVSAADALEWLGDLWLVLCVYARTPGVRARDEDGDGVAKAVGRWAHHTASYTIMQSVRRGSWRHRGFDFAAFIGTAVRRVGVARFLHEDVVARLYWEHVTGLAPIAPMGDPAPACGDLLLWPSEPTQSLVNVAQHWWVSSRGDFASCVSSALAQLRINGETAAAVCEQWIERCAKSSTASIRDLTSCTHAPSHVDAGEGGCSPPLSSASGGAVELLLITLVETVITPPDWQYSRQHE